MNLVQAFLQRAADNKEYLTVNLSCKWTPISQYGEHLISSMFCFPDESTLHVRIRVIENLLAVKLIPITIPREEFAELFVTLKISRKVDKGENRSLDVLLNIKDTNFGPCTRCHKPISCTLSLTYMTITPIIWTEKH